jgi:hypothetical protein
LTTRRYISDYAKLQADRWLANPSSSNEMAL